MASAPPDFIHPPHQVKEVVMRAEALRAAQGAHRIHLEHVVVGLFDAADVFTGDPEFVWVAETFRRAGLTRRKMVERLDALTGFVDRPYSPEIAVSPLEFSAHARMALAPSNSPLGDAAELLRNLVTVPCRVVDALNPLRQVVLGLDADEMPALPSGTRPDLGMLNDDAVDQDEHDLLGFGAYADSIAALIDNPRTAPPLTMAISAPWGAGKTTLARLVQQRLMAKPSAGGFHPHVTCWFNAWMHDGAKDLASAFAAEVARAADRCRPWWRRFLNPLPAAMLPVSRRSRRRALRWGALAAAAVALTYTLHQASPAFGNAVVKGLFPKLQTPSSDEAYPALLIVVGFLLWLLQNASTTAKALASFVNDPKGAAAAGGLEEAREQLTALISQATPPGSRFVVFVDDLERCRPPRPVEVLEVVNQLLSHANVVTVLIADLPAVAACADIKYRELANRYQPDSQQQPPDGGSRGLSYGWLYLQKIVQLRFDMPPYAAGDMQRLIDHTGRWSMRRDDSVRVSRSDLAGVEVLRGFTPGFVHLSLIDWFRAMPALVQQALSRLMWPGRALVATIRELVYPAHTRVQIGTAGRPGAEAAAAFAYLLGNLLFYYGLVMLAVWVRQRRAPSQVWEGMVAAAPIAWMLLAFAIIAALVAAIRQLVDDRDLTGRARRTLDLQIRTGLERPSEITAQAPEELGSASASMFARERINLYLIERSAILNAARAEAMKHIAALPRSTKRLTNDLSLLLYIAAERRIFGGVPTLTPAHLGKWAALRDRWPDLARLVAARPELLAPMEDASADGDKDLQRFLEAEPRLSPVLERLVRFEPAAAEAEAPQAV